MTSSAQNGLSQQIAEITGHNFTDHNLLRRAFTHKSLSSDFSYERLEFFGDRVLGLIISHQLYARFGDDDQGKLTRRLHAITQEDYLSQIARESGLVPLILHEQGEQIAQRPSVQCDVVEALIAALYLDGGIEAAEGFILKYWTFTALAPTRNPKSALQEWAAAQKMPQPVYRLVEKTGSDHNPSFTAEVRIDGQGAETAAGQSIKAAEADAARRLLSRLSSE